MRISPNVCGYALIACLTFSSAAVYAANGSEDCAAGSVQTAAGCGPQCSFGSQVGGLINDQCLPAIIAVGPVPSEVLSIAGAYRGSITSLDSGTQLGSIEIDLLTSLIEVPTSDTTTTTTNPQNIILGTVKITGQLIGEAPITQAAYDTASGNLTGSILIQPNDGQSYVLTIAGNIKNGTLTGKILSNSDASVGGNFTAALNVPLPAPPSAAPSLAGKYAGTFDASQPNADISIQMEVRPSTTTAQQNALSLLSGTQNSDLTMSFVHDGVIDATLSFKNVQVDNKNGRLSGVTTFADSGAIIILNCQTTRSLNVALNCQYVSSTGVHASFVASAVK